MKIEGSSPRSQQSATCLSPGAEQSSSRPLLFLKKAFLVLFSHLRLFFQVIYYIVFGY
jgi:hypothetical protein